MKKIKLNVEGITPNNFNPQNTYVLILSDDETSKNKLPIVIGALEAQAISLALENIKTPRPLTIDLLASVIKQTGYILKEVVINNLNKGIFYANLVLEKDGKEINIDSRVSDAVALALRTSSPIYILKHIFEENAYSLDQLTSNKKQVDEEVEEDYTIRDDKWLVQHLFNLKLQKKIDNLKEILTKIPDDKLNNMLKIAVEEEKYEVAAYIRDELKNRGKS
jgi:bifunctional DNase/RNase